MLQPGRRQQQGQAQPGLAAVAAPAVQRQGPAPPCRRERDAAADEGAGQQRADQEEAGAQQPADGATAGNDGVVEEQQARAPAQRRGERHAQPQAALDAGGQPGLRQAQALQPVGPQHVAVAGQQRLQQEEQPRQPPPGAPGAAQRCQGLQRLGQLPHARGQLGWPQPRIQRLVQRVGQRRAQQALGAEVVQPAEVGVQRLQERVRQRRCAQHPFGKRGRELHLPIQRLLVHLGPGLLSPGVQQRGLAAVAPAQRQLLDELVGPHEGCGRWRAFDRRCRYGLGRRGCRSGGLGLNSSGRLLSRFLLLPLCPVLRALVGAAQRLVGLGVIVRPRGPELDCIRLLDGGEVGRRFYAQPGPVFFPHSVNRP